MKTILHVIDTTGPGGAETVFINLLRALQKTDYRNIVVLRGEGWVAEEVRALGIEPLLVDSKGSFNMSYLITLRRMVAKEAVDLIHTHLMGSNVYGALLAILTRKPMIATFHGAVDVSARERFLGIKFGIVGLGAKAIVCVSKKLQKDLVDRGTLPVKKLLLIYNGVDPTVFSDKIKSGLRQELGLPKDATLVVSIGNIRPAKGYQYLIDAAVSLGNSDNDIHFVVVGHQKEVLFNQLLGQIAQAPVQPKIHWLGFRRDVANILSQADIFLLPSISEGFSISTVEAMMVGVPVIATRSGGPEEIIVDGETGILVPIENSEAIVGAIQALDDPQIRKKLAEKARENAFCRFSLATMLDQYRDLYEHLTEGRGSRHQT